jgi:putative transposase
LYFWKQLGDDLKSPAKRGPKGPPSNKLKIVEERKVKSLLLKLDWANENPEVIYYKSLDENREIVASVSTLYKIARKERLLTKRVKSSPTKPLNRKTPHLVATGPNQVWSWDVTQVPSLLKTVRYYLYVIMDIWSRLVVGWRFEENEQTDKAIGLWKQALLDQNISGKGLTNHKDNGSIMRAHAMLKFVKDAEMIDSYSRAGVSDDNPFSEALFKTIKYYREFPNKMKSIELGREYFKPYFNGYNYEHRHSGIQFLTPAQRHHGEEEKILNIRNETIAKFYEKNKHRYSSAPKLFKPIWEVKIN